MYDSMVRNYRVVFEVTGAPIFYKTFYPRGIGKDNQDHWDYYHYVRGLKNNPGEQFSDDRDYQDYSTHVRDYERDLSDFLDRFSEDTNGRSCGVVVVPSSTAGKVNRVTELARKVIDAKCATTICDLTRCLQRTDSKETAHLKGSRSISDNLKTLSVSPPRSIQNFDFILVLDDVVTTGNSFLAVNNKLKEAGFGGKIVNFAFAKTCPSEGIELYKQWDARNGSTGATSHQVMLPCRVDGVVFDFDDTLVLDTPRNADYEDGLYGHESPDAASSCPYRPYSGVRDFMNLGIPFTIVSNRSIRTLRQIIEDPAINDSIYPGRAAHDGRILEEWKSSGDRFYPLEPIRGTGTKPNQHENVFSYQQRCVDGDKRKKPINLYKPCPQSVLQAIQSMRSSHGLAADSCIVGVGNTLEDIIAYNAAGIESVLALWGVPTYLRQYAEYHWGADYSFKSIPEFGQWCRGIHRVAYQCPF